MGDVWCKVVVVDPIVHTLLIFRTPLDVLSSNLFISPSPSLASSQAPSLPRSPHWPLANPSLGSHHVVALPTSLRPSVPFTICLDSRDDFDPRPPSVERGHYRRSIFSSPDSDVNLRTSLRSPSSFTKAIERERDAYHIIHYITIPHFFRAAADKPRQIAFRRRRPKERRGGSLASRPRPAFTPLC